MSYLLPEERVYKIMARNTGAHIVMDQKDWMILRDVHLIEIKGGVTTLAGVKIEQYLKIVGTRRADAPKHDYRRMWYD